MTVHPDIIREALEGEQVARALVATIREGCTSGDELATAAAGAGRQHESWRRGFWRAVQKTIEAGAAG